MPTFKIYVEEALGFSHSGEVSADGVGEVELTDEEVSRLVQLIRDCDGETDVDEIDLEGELPDIYDALEEAYRELAFRVEYIHWVVEGYENGYYEISTDEAIEKCREEYGFEYEFDKAKFLEENPDYEEEDIDDDVIDEAKEEALGKWVDEYRSRLDDYHAALFLDEVFELNPNIVDYDFSVEIPEEIIEMALNDNGQGK